MISPTELFTLINTAKKTGQRKIELGVPVVAFGPGATFTLGQHVAVPGDITGRVAAFRKDHQGRECVILAFNVGDLEAALTAALRGERPKDVMPETEFKVRRGTE